MSDPYQPGKDYYIGYFTALRDVAKKVEAQGTAQVLNVVMELVVEAIPESAEYLRKEVKVPNE